MAFSAKHKTKGSDVTQAEFESADSHEITATDAAADDSTKGVATFEADDFDSASGKIDLAASVLKQLTGDSGTATPTAHSVEIEGGTGMTTAGSAAKLTVSQTALTASRAVVTDGSGNYGVATTTATEIGYVNGVTSAIQTQIDSVTKVVWKDASENALSDVNRTATLGFTDLDLTAYTSADAKFAILDMVLNLDSYTSGYVSLSVRKNGTTPVVPLIMYATNEACADKVNRQEVVVGLDAGEVIEYSIVVSDTAQVDSYISVLGYIE